MEASNLTGWRYRVWAGRVDRIIADLDLYEIETHWLNAKQLEMLSLAKRLLEESK